MDALGYNRCDLCDHRGDRQNVTLSLMFSHAFSIQRPSVDPAQTVSRRRKQLCSVFARETRVTTRTAYVFADGPHFVILRLSVEIQIKFAVLGSMYLHMHTRIYSYSVHIVGVTITIITPLTATGPN